jgi:[ribosomal protein S5]-alanine N-acetyltransferase
MSLDLRTNRFELCPVRLADVEALHALWTASGVRRFLWDGEIISIARTSDIVATSERLFRVRRFGLWGAWLPARTQLIGFCGFWHFRDPPELELLFGVRESQWRRGYATEISGAVVEYGFGVVGFDCIRASTDAENVASVRVLEKLEFRFLSRVVVGGLDTRFYKLEQRAV